MVNKSISNLMKIIIGAVVFSALFATLTTVHASWRKSKTSEYSISAGSLIKNYTENEINADNKFKGHTISVYGVVKLIGKDFMGYPLITIGTGEALEIPVVQCFLTKVGAKSAASLKPGDQVTVKGRVKGLMTNVILDHCDIS